MSEFHNQYDATEGDLWEAYRYVSGEMSDAEEAAFEGRLAVEQPLREAVAAVVETESAVCCIESERQVVRTKRPAVVPRRRVHVGLFAAASAVLAIALVVFLRGGNDPVEPKTDVADNADLERRLTLPVDDGDRTDDIVAFWSTPTEPRRPSVEDRDLGDWLDEADAVATDEEEEFVVPGWMLAAIAPETMEEMMDTMGESPRENN